MKDVSKIDEFVKLIFYESESTMGSWSYFELFNCVSICSFLMYHLCPGILNKQLWINYNWHIVLPKLLTASSKLKNGVDNIRYFRNPKPFKLQTLQTPNPSNFKPFKLQTLNPQTLFVIFTSPNGKFYTESLLNAF